MPRSAPRQTLSQITSYSNFRNLILVLFGVAALATLIVAVRNLPVTTDNIYPEAAGVAAARRWASGFPLYSDFRQPPYLLTGFPPLWYAIVTLAAEAGFSSMDRLTLFGRLLSFASLLAIAGFSIRWNQQRGLNIRTALVTPLIFLSLPILGDWCATARQDLPAILLSFLAVLLVVQRPTSARIFLAAFVAGLSFLMKHSSVAAPAAIGLWLLGSRRWKHAIAFCAVWFALVGGTFWAFARSNTELIRWNMTGVNYGGISLARAHQVLSILTESKDSGFTVVAFALAAFGLLCRWRDANGRTRLWAIYFLTSLGFAFLGSGFANGYVNYYLEPGLVWAIFAADAIEALRDAWPERTPIVTFVLVLLVVVLLPAYDMPRWRIFSEKPNDLRPFLALVEGKRVLTDCPYLAARSGTQELIDPVSMMYAEKAGRWSSSPIVQALRSKRFDFVLVRRDMNDPAWETSQNTVFNRSMRAAISENYGLCFERFPIFVYGPRLAAGRGGSEISCPSSFAVSPRVK
jgi:hypothetical protein